MKPLTAYFKHQGENYCDCLNKIIWKLITMRNLPIKKTTTNRHEFLAVVDTISSEATDQLQMNGNPYEITWSEGANKFILYKPHKTPDHIKRIL